VRDLEAYLTDPLSRCGGVCGWAEFGQVACRLFGPVRRSLCPALSELPLHSRSANEGPIYRHRHNLGDCVGMAAGLSRSYLRHVLASPVGKRKRKGLDRDLFILRLACIWRRKRKVAVCIYRMRSEVSDRQVGWLQPVTCNDGLALHSMGAHGMAHKGLNERYEVHGIKRNSESIHNSQFTSQLLTPPPLSTSRIFQTVAAIYHQRLFEPKNRYIVIHHSTLPHSWPAYVCMYVTVRYLGYHIKDRSLSRLGI
jgi:hypothetical protein